MNVIRFLARDAADAVAQVRAQLGAGAVVLSVNQLPSKGVSRLWRKPLLEVCATLPEGLPNAASLDSASPELPPRVQSSLRSLEPEPRLAAIEPAASGARRAEAGMAAAVTRPGSERKGLLQPSLDESEVKCCPVALDNWPAECGPPMSWSEARDLAGVNPGLPSESRRGAGDIAGGSAIGGASRPSGTVRDARTPPKRGSRGARAGHGIPAKKRVVRSRLAPLGKLAKSKSKATPTNYGRLAPGPAPPLPRAGVSALPEPGLMSAGGAWSSGKVLFQLGLHPLMVEKVMERVRATHGDRPPSSFAEELAQVKHTLNSFWRPPVTSSRQPPALHGFIGPPGSGKTTTLCKWLAKSILAENRRARVWRLDSRAANFAGLLDLFGEILAVPVERDWSGGQNLNGLEIGFLDFPGINPQDQAALEQLRGQLHGITGLEIHLVLNAAYDLSVLLEQVRALEILPVTDLIFTHLDEEKRHGKLWNFILGTKYTIRFLSGGQNIPGDFRLAAPELLISS